MKLARLWFAVALVACASGNNHNAGVGELGGSCYPNLTCNPGLVCTGGVCMTGLDLDAAIAHDTALDPDAAAPPDAAAQPDGAVIPDAAVPDAAVAPDAAVMIDAAVTPDAMVDAGAMPDASTSCNVLTQSGCTTGEKCTWILDTDPTMTTNGIGHLGCAPAGPVATGNACTIRSAATGGYDNCIKADACVSGLCKPICDTAGGAPACGTNQACVTYDGLFANAGQTAAAGVCDPTCDPLADNDFDGSATVHNKTGTACTTDPTEGCYGSPSSTHTTFFTCAHPATSTELLTHRAVLAPNLQFLNSCMSGYTIAFAHDADGSNNIDCYAWCKPGETYLGNPAAQAPNGVAPHRCNTTDALGAFGATPTGTAASNGEHCVYSWIFELDTANNLHKSPTSNTVGLCWDHTKYKYDSNGDGIADTILPPCAALPLTSTGALTAVDLSCVMTTTAGLGFSGKPLARRPYIEAMPEIPALQPRR